MHERLRACPSVPALFSAASQTATDAGLLDRCVLLTVSGGHLTADDSGPLADPASDAIRRRLLARPIALVGGTLEAEVVRRPGRVLARGSRPSGVADALELSHHHFCAVVADGACVALLVGDRKNAALQGEETADIDRLGAVVAFVLQQIVLRARVADLASELRHLTSSTQALARDVLDGPVLLPSAQRTAPSSARFHVPTPTGDSLEHLLTARERQIATLLIQGLENRQIAATLVLSPNTVKSHVGRILRKLGATNRADAVGRLVRIGDLAD